MHWHPNFTTAYHGLFSIVSLHCPKCESISTSRRFQPGESPSWGLLRDCENPTDNRDQRLNNTAPTVPDSEARVVVGAGVEAGQVGVGGHGGQGVVARLLGLVRLVAPRVELLVLLRRVTARHLPGGHSYYLQVDQLGVTQY